MNDELCPCCHNYCQKETLGCERGIKYFAGNDNIEEKGIKAQVIADLRKCGHYLHHNKDSENLLKEFSEEELECLHKHLKKFVMKNKNVLTLPLV